MESHFSSISISKFNDFLKVNFIFLLIIRFYWEEIQENHTRDGISISFCNIIKKITAKLLFIMKIYNGAHWFSSVFFIPAVEKVVSLNNSWPTNEPVIYLAVGVMKCHLWACEEFLKTLIPPWNPTSSKEKYAALFFSIRTNTWNGSTT